MKTEENCAGGETVLVSRKDSLERVPETHASLLTTGVREAFPDPIAYFRKVAARSRFVAFRAWLERLLQGNQWELRLHTNGFESPGIAAFAFRAPSITIAELAPPQSEPLDDSFPDEIVEFYSLVDWVHWSVYGGAGGIERGGPHRPISAFGKKFVGSKINPKKAGELGSTGCGDMFIYTSDGRGGMLCHENLHVHLIGTIGETFEWIFQELLEGREPEFNYGEWLRH
jgi:hypothetical protein